MSSLTSSCIKGSRIISHRKQKLNQNEKIIKNHLHNQRSGRQVLEELKKSGM